MPTELVYTPIDDIPQVHPLVRHTNAFSKRTQICPSQIHADLRKSFRAGKLKSIEARKTQILQLAYLLQDNYERFISTFAQDLGRPPLEVTLYVPVASTGKDASLCILSVSPLKRPG